MVSVHSGCTHGGHSTTRESQLVELKNGETFNGHLVNCDNFMNITLREVYQTSAEGDKFWKLKECYIRGSTVSSNLTLRSSCYLAVAEWECTMYVYGRDHASGTRKGGRIASIWSASHPSPSDCCRNVFLPRILERI